MPSQTGTAREETTGARREAPPGSATALLCWEQGTLSAGDYAAGGLLHHQEGGREGRGAHPLARLLLPRPLLQLLEGWLVAERGQLELAWERRRGREEKTPARSAKAHCRCLCPRSGRCVMQGARHSWSSLP